MPESRARAQSRAPLWSLVAALVAGCGPRQAEPVVKPNMDPYPDPIPPVAMPPAPPPAPKTPVLPASEAYRRGLMPQASTNVWAYRQAHPNHDGRGVLIAILDSGIDAGVAGLITTSTGEKKVLDLRDFSGEGRVSLSPITLHGDSATVAGRTLAGFRRLAGLSGGPHLGGFLAERPLGKLPASDLNGNGGNADSLAVVVTRASDGWILLADTDGDRTLDDEKPVRDYLVAKETFGWSTAGRPSPITIAVNFPSGSAAPPATVDLLFDNSGHGTHVAGIAAGSGLYGVTGFDGAAPGAQLLGLKIANNALGGISVTGSMLRAIDYAIGFAQERRLPLVLNMSFGVGNEAEGAARIDRLIDSILVANPEVVFVTSAGNDGPGLSTMGFPASSTHALTVGAIFPSAFLDRPPPNEVVAFFSSRGGELSKPDVLAPGIAYSSVPRWDTGSEDKSGTSMASPHVAGAVAILVGAAKAENRTLRAAQIKQAVVAGARPVPGALAPDQGAGLLDLVAADRVLRRLPAMAVMRAGIGQPAGGAFRLLGPGRAADTTVTVVVSGTLGGPARVATDVSWLVVPQTAQLTPPETRIPVEIRASLLPEPGVYAGTVTGWSSDTTIGPLFRATATVVRPHEIPDSALVVSSELGTGGTFRVFLPADSARPFRVRMASAGPQERLLAFLHEPGGQPYRVENGLTGGPGDAAATYEVDGRDVVAGYYEALAVAPPTAALTAQVRIDRSPVILAASRTHKDTVTATLTGASSRATGTAMFGLIGAERAVAFSQKGGAERRIPFRAPAWAKRLVVDLTLPRAAWPLFTDFGLAVVDQAGQILEAAPMNYAFGRAAVDLPEATRDRDLTVVLAPGLADPAASPLWEGDLSIRLYAESPVLMEPHGAPDFALAEGARATIRFPLGTFPWSLPDGFFPLGNLVVDSQGTLWGFESKLPPPTPPIMR